MATFTIYCENSEQRDDIMWQLRHGQSRNCGYAGLKLSYEAEAELSFEPVTVRRHLAPILRSIARRLGKTYRATALHLDGEFIPDYCRNEWAREFRSEREFQAAKRLAQRLARRAHYEQEVLPAWQDVQTVYYMDNSVEVIQRATDVRTQTRMVTAPGGDACY